MVRRISVALILTVSVAFLMFARAGFGTSSVSVAQEKQGKKTKAATANMESQKGKVRTVERLSRGANRKSKGSYSALSDGERFALAACVENAITIPTTVNGTIESGDCVLEDNTLYDIYKFSGTAGQQISITYTSSAFDAYLFLVDFDGQTAIILGEDDDGGGGPSGTNSRIPSGTGVASLPYTGDYFILANTFAVGEMGSYQLEIATSAGNCPTSPPAIAIGTTNGTLATSDCRFVDDTHYDAYTFNGTAGQQISILQTAGFDSVLYLLANNREILGANDDGGGGANSRIPATSGFVTLPYTGTYFVVANALAPANPNTAPPTGAYQLTIADGGTCPTNPITIGQTISNGALAATDCKLPDESFVDIYTLSGTAGQQIAIEMTSTAFDTFLYLAGTDTQLLQFNDDNPPGTNSRIPVGSGFFTLPTTGTYRIFANSFDPGVTGAYNLSVTQSVVSATNVQFSSAGYGATEGAHFVTLTVTRTGDTAGASTVGYGTADGTATERKDYTAAVGRVRFAAGETSKNLNVLIVDDRFADNGETFTVTLSNPSGATLGAQSSASVTISDGGEANATSPLRDGNVDVPFFVRLHYADFLGRVPDQAGLDFWVGVANGCGDPDLLVCRINVSAAFFLAIENQEAGYLVHRTHKVAFGNLPGKPVPLRLRDYLAGQSRVAEGIIVGVPGWPEQFEANKVAFFNEFVDRGDFDARYALLTNAEYVDALNANAGNVLTPGERSTLIDQLNASQRTRAQVLRAVAENPTFANGPEKNRAFVLAQYFGYLRRNPDDIGFDGNPDPAFNGFNFWLTRLNANNGNFIQAEMVKAFILSIEYIERAGQ
jgi:hypothetical protein